MPTNKHASFRYRVLNQCFTNRGRRKWSLAELVNETSRYLSEEFGSDTEVGQRTIQGDINVMRSAPPRGFYAPILCAKGLYYYADPDFSIEKPQFKQEELALLRESLALVKQIPGMRQLPLLDWMVQRFEHLAKTPTAAPIHIQIETNEQAQGTEWITPLYEAIVHHQVLKIGYQPFLEKTAEYVLHPYLLKEWRNRWYVFGRKGASTIAEPAIFTHQIERLGFIPRTDGIWNFALDRITSLARADDVAFLPNELFDPDTWFDDIVGINKPENADPIEIELEMDPIASYYLETKPLHRSQHLVHRDEHHAVFTLKLIPNFEIVHDLLSYGKYIRVRSPDLFVQMMTESRGKCS